VNPAYDRYDDRDVRGDAGLYAAADAYVRGYVGDFVFLRDLRDRLAEGAALTVSQARAALNCMRADPRVAELPRPDLGDNVVEFRLPRSRRRAQPPPPRRPFDLPLAWKKPYGVSNHRRARRVHVLDTHSRDRCRLTYTPQPAREQYRYNWHMRWVCSVHMTPVYEPYENSPTWRHCFVGYDIELLTRAEAADLAAQDEWGWCRQCLQTLERRGVELP